MNKITKKLKHLAVFLENHPRVTSYGLLVLVLFFLSWLAWSPLFQDPDAFYHIKIAELMREQKKIISEFPWLPQTILPKIFADQAFAYHALLIPFTYLPDPLIGLKIATVLFATLTLMTIHWLLKQFSVKHAWLYIFTLLLVSTFITRISFAKPSALAISMFLLGLYAILKQKKLTLFGVSFFYVWIHGSWPLLAVAAFIYWIVSGIFQLANNTQNNATTKQSNTIKNLIKSIITTKTKSIFLISTAGSLSGFLLNPAFPQNIKFFWYQTVLISIKNYKNVIGVGSEWYGISLPDLISNNIIISFLALITLVIFTLTIKNQDKKSWFLFLLCAFLLIITLKSRRFGEFFDPTIILFSSITITKHSKKALKMLKFSAQNKIHAKITAIFITLGLMSQTGYVFYSYSYFKTSQYPLDRFERFSEWSEKNLDPGSTIINTYWGDFPLLFYQNSGFNYTIGLDPTFLYLASKDRHAYWNDLLEKPKTVDISPATTKHHLKNSTILLHPEDKTLIERLTQSKQWQKTYEDSEAVLFQEHKTNE